MQVLRSSKPHVIGLRVSALWIEISRLQCFKNVNKRVCRYFAFRHAIMDGPTALSHMWKLRREPGLLHCSDFKAYHGFHEGTGRRWGAVSYFLELYWCTVENSEAQQRTTSASPTLLCWFSIQISAVYLGFWTLVVSVHFHWPSTAFSGPLLL